MTGSSTQAARAPEPAPRFGRFELVEPFRVSQGMRVGLYFDRERGERVVLKALRERADERRYAARLRRELHVLRRVRHPGLVRLLDWERSESPRFLVLRWYRGGSLRRRMSGAPLPGPHRAAELVRDLAHAAHHLHRCGRVHLDLKCDNILLDERHGAVLCDFGMCLSHRSLRRARGYLGGTPGAMSPEQAGFFPHRRVDGRADVFALGVVLYELLVGRLPIGGTRRSSYLRNLAGVFDSPVIVPPHVPGPLVTVVQRALGFHPTSRYRTAELLARALDRTLDADLDSLGERAPRPSESA